MDREPISAELADPTGAPPAKATPPEEEHHLRPALAAMVRLFCARFMPEVDFSAHDAPAPDTRH